MDVKAVVVKALEDPRWEWRTVDGIARETGVAEAQVLQILESSPDEVIRSRTSDAQGRALYTSRRHYTQKQSLFERFRSS